MARVPLLKVLQRTFPPTSFGDADREEWQGRLEDYLEEARGKTAELGLEPGLLYDAQLAWAKYLAYTDAINYAVQRAETVTVNGEGSVNHGERAAVLKALRLERDAARAEYDRITARPPAPQTRDGGTLSIETETVW